ncbi:hypothetical protein [Sphingomonas oligophenolica]|uniref:hypothetical protein n=1 Tax=Sphingomonas oligophenolica TaxID=301154 RepID=UPI001387569F|nr:hypothetical protein [Sphingomonas oligophenolica]
MEKVEFDISDLDLDAIEVVATSGYMAIPETGASCCYGSSSCSGSTQPDVSV